MSTANPTTINDIAKEAGVAKATVSLAMRNKGGISSETRRRILEIARKLDYRPSPSRQTRGRVYQGQVAFLSIGGKTPRTSDEPGASYLHSMIDGCNDLVQDRGGITSIVKSTVDQIAEGRAPLGLDRGNFDGLIVRSVMNDDVMALLAKCDVPYVLVDCDRFVHDKTQVQIENIQASDRLVEHFLATGAKQFAIITGDIEHLNAQERLAGVQMALQRRGHQLDPDLIIYERGFDEASGSRGAAALLAGGKPFDALICQNDLIAMAAINQLQAAGLSIPEDVRVSGFDNMSFARTLPVPLTTVDPFAYQMGLTAARLLLDSIDSGKHQVCHIKQHAELVIRQSTNASLVASVSSQ